MISNPTNKFLQALIAGLLATLGSFYLLVSIAAKPQAVPKLTGDLWVSGPVTLNGVVVKTGITVFNGSRIKTASTGTATINFNRLGRVRLEPETEIVLRFSETLVGGELVSGNALVNAHKGVDISIVTPSGLVESDSTQITALQVTVTTDSTDVVATKGEAKITYAGKIERVNTGEEVAISKNGRGTARKWLTAAAIGGGGGASSFGKLASTSITASVNSITGSASQGSSNDPTAAQPSTSSNTAAQISAGPSATPTPKPVTPVKPPPTVDVCGCKFNANTGQAIDPNQQVTICHVPANDPTKRQTITLSCSALTGHFNLNATPRTGHLCDVCTSCANYTPPATCPAQ